MLLRPISTILTTLVPPIDILFLYLFLLHRLLTIPPPQVLLLLLLLLPLFFFMILLSSLVHYYYIITIATTIVALSTIFSMFCLLGEVFFFLLKSALKSAEKSFHELWEVTKKH